MNIAILIPAAGASRRIGTPKQLLKWGNSTLLGHAIETAEQLNPSEIIVVLGAYYDKIKGEIDHNPIKILKHENWENGLGSSIAFGVKHILTNANQFDAVLIYLPDQPLIVSKYLIEMANKFKFEDHKIIATSYGNEKFGVPAIFDKTYFEELEALKDDEGAKKLIEKYSESATSLDISPLIADIDTEEDYKILYDSNHQS